MRHQIRSEVRKLITTRSAYMLLGGLVAMVALGAVAVALDTKGPAISVPLEGQPFLHVAMLIAPVFALLLGLRSFTDEFRFGSIVPTLLAEPRRLRVLGAKLVAVGAAAVALALAALATGMVAGVIVQVVRHAHTAGSPVALAELAGRLAAAAALWAAIGVGVGLAVRHQVAAVAGSLVWLLAGEGLLSGVMPRVARFFPGSAGFAVTGLNASRLLSPASAAVVLGAYAMVAVVAGGALMRRRDIT
jgi:hypothetical protein